MEKRYIRAKVKAGRKRERIEDRGNDLWNIEVREPAERGAANARVRTLLADALGVPAVQLRLVKGAKTPSKIYLFANA